MTAVYFDANVRIDQLILIPAAVIDEEAFSEAFEEFCESLPEKSDALLYQQLPLMARFAGPADTPEPSDVGEVLAMNGVVGFFILAATPYRDYLSKASGAYMSSWGHFHTCWLYAATAEEIPTVTVAWAETVQAADREEAKEADDED